MTEEEKDPEDRPEAEEMWMSLKPEETYCLSCGKTIGHTDSCKRIRGGRMNFLEAVEKMKEGKKVRIYGYKNMALHVCPYCGYDNYGYDNIPKCRACGEVLKKWK